MAKKPKKAGSQSQAAPTPRPTQSNAARPGFFMNSANFLLSRLPWFQDRYENWGKGKRVLIAFLLYLIILPVIPIVIGVVMYLRDPEGFKKSKALPILAAIAVAQLGAFGLIATQPPTVNNPETNSVQSSPSTKNGGTPATSKSNTTTSAKSANTGGRYFENCTAAFNAGVFNIPKSDKSYRRELDGDDNGVGCQK